MKKYLLFSLILLVSCQTDSKHSASIDIATAMSESNGAFKKADSVIDFEFPEDHAAHDDFKIEWWYFTGNLEDSEGRRFGYQFTIFRNALDAETDTSRGSTWYSNQFYFANFAVTDVNNNEFRFAEKFSREASGLAGTQSDPFKVYVEDWSVKAKYPDDNYVMPHYSINAIAVNYSIDLKLKPLKKPVFHGENGLSQKSSTPGNASYYYSYTRMKTEGSIQLGDDIYQVSGFSWMDREWSTSALEDGQQGWDWFSLKLDDTTEIMYFQIRDDSANMSFAKGTYIYKSGDSEFIKSDEIDLKASGSWENDRGDIYPSGWVLSYPKKGIELTLTPLVKDQELKTTFRYWEGALLIEGSKAGQDIEGYGYAELTGYAGKPIQ